MIGDDTAFPLPPPWAGRGTNEEELGLSKREYFAANAMLAVFGRGDFAHLTLADRALIAVRIADAMLLALTVPRDQRPGGPPCPIAD